MLPFNEEKMLLKTKNS